MIGPYEMDLRETGKWSYDAELIAPRFRIWLQNQPMKKHFVTYYRFSWMLVR